MSYQLFKDGIMFGMEGGAAELREGHTQREEEIQGFIKVWEA